MANHEFEIEQATKILGEERLECLREIFKDLKGTPPQLHKKRYRAEHYTRIETLDYLEQSVRLLNTEGTGNEHYRLSPYAIPFIKSQRSDDLLQIMVEIYSFLGEKYKERLDLPITNEEIIQNSSKWSRDDCLEALFYMSRAHSVWTSMTHEFPYKEGSQIAISEDVIKKKSFWEVLTDYYRWHFINPKQELSPKNIENLFSTDAEQGSRFFNADDKKNYPAWFDRLGDSEKALIIEIDKGLQSHLRALPVMGVRALIENVMLGILPDQGSFKANLNEFKEKGFITSQNADLLYKVIDAGSAVIHRAHIPSEKDVKTCIEVVKHLLHGVYVIKPQVDELHESVPQRHG